MFFIKLKYYWYYYIGHVASILAYTELGSRVGFLYELYQNYMNKASDIDFEYRLGYWTTNLEAVDEFQLEHFGRSDGIGECEEIIRKSGGSIQKGVIRFPKETKEWTTLTSKAVNYLCNEWDYGYEHN
jgi:hypothetical protein